MELIINPVKKDWKEILKRPYGNRSMDDVGLILKEVRRDGDKALRSFSEKFDGVVLDHLEISKEELNNASSQLSDDLKQSIDQAKKNIEAFHRSQLSRETLIETMPGIQCWRKSIGIEKIGLYIPGGTAPLFSTVLMLGIPAKIAGCNEIILCSPSDKAGNIHPAIVYAAQLVGVTRIFKIGGAQAIGAMAYGTESVPAVYKIFGPGNQYVTAAKQLVQMEGVAIDMPAGPSEVCVLADNSANASFIASDLLSQAEHGKDSQVLFVTNNEDLVGRVKSELDKQLERLPRKSIAQAALANSKAIVVDLWTDAIEIINEYAPEHLIICCEDADAIAEKVRNAGSVFIGNYSPESVGDYASGTNHTLPTNGFAKAYSGVSVDSFVKKITYQKLSREGLVAISKTVIEMAEAEGLQAHAEAVRVRL